MLYLCSFSCFLPDLVCTFWETEVENLLRLFWECGFMLSFWKELEGWLNIKLDLPVCFSKLTRVSTSKYYCQFTIKIERVSLRRHGSQYF